jgi:FixJ family two-component response regulator
MMAEAFPTVFVVEDDGAVREALDSLLRSAGYHVKLFSSAREFLQQRGKEDIGCLILDVRLPGASGLDLQQGLIKEDIHIPTIFITGHGDIRMSVQAIKAGAMEFLTKPIDQLALLDAVERALEKARTQLKDKSELASLRRRFDALTPRERGVIQLVVAGLLNKQIAAEVGISEVTVKIHRGNAMRKMEATSLAELVRMAGRLNLPTD